MSTKRVKTSEELEAELKKKQQEEKELKASIKKRKAEEADKEFRRQAEVNAKGIEDCNNILGTSDGIGVVKSFIEYASQFKANDGKTIIEHFKIEKQR